VCWKPCSSCWSFHLLREEFLSAPIHSPLSGSPYRSFRRKAGSRPRAREKVGRVFIGRARFEEVSPKHHWPQGWRHGRGGGWQRVAGRRLMAEGDACAGECGEAAWHQLRPLARVNGLRCTVPMAPGLRPMGLPVSRRARVCGYSGGPTWRARRDVVRVPALWLV
jgi:hypothetical protein